VIKETLASVGGHPSARDGERWRRAFGERGATRLRCRPIAESVARSVCGLVRTTTVLSGCDRGLMRKSAGRSLGTVR
jgi:hypothetical protein